MGKRHLSDQAIVTVERNARAVVTRSCRTQFVLPSLAFGPFYGGDAASKYPFRGITRQVDRTQISGQSVDRRPETR